MIQTEEHAETIFDQLGVRPIINACGIYTDLGGSVLSPRVWAGMEEINRRFVNMPDLLDSSGHALASMVGAEAARATTGAAAAITLGIAACVAGDDGDNWERLPDTSGMKNEVVIQRGHRYKYDRCARMAGVKLVEAGDEAGTTRDALHSTMSANTAAVLFPGHLNGKPGTLLLEETIAIAATNRVPVFVDAAYLNFPPEKMRSLASSGADLVCFSAKYYGGPNSGGFLCGRKHLIEAFAGLDFTRYESGRYRTFGRPFKLDRYTIVGIVFALKEWMAMDHNARWESYKSKVCLIIQKLSGISTVALSPGYFTMDERLLHEPINCLRLTPLAGTTFTAQDIAKELADGDPSIAALVIDDQLVVAVDTVLDGQETVIANRLLQILESTV